jgi:hypothetical protein
MKHFLEIGMGNDYSTDATKADGGAKVSDGADYGIAIGHDCFADKDNSIAFGSFQKALEVHTIAEGQYFCKVERFGEKRRAFAGDNNYYSRSWFEWMGRVTPIAEPPGPNYVPITLHNQTSLNLDLVNYSALIFNIKVIGSNENSSPDVNGYHISGVIKRGANAGTTALVGTPIVDAWEDNTSLDFRVVADTGNGSLVLEALTHPSEYWRWVASGWVSEMRWTI